MSLNITVKPKYIRTMLIVIACLIAIFSLITEYLVEVVYAGQQYSIWLDFLDLFSVNLEDSIPTWYSVIILIIASIILCVIAYAKSQAKDQYALYWWGLASLFFYFSMDEGATIHEIIATPLHLAFNTSGFLTFGWQIVAVPLVVIFGLVYLRFLFHLPVKTRNWFILGAVLYAGGALIFEGFSASQYASSGITMTYLSLATVEEFCEILGVSLFIFALLDYVQQMDYQLHINAHSASETSIRTATSVEEQTPVKNSWHGAFNPLVVLVLFLLLTNIGSLAWILGARPEVTESAPPPFYETHLTELETAQVTILEAPDVFGIETNHSLETVRLLSASHAEIYVVAFPSENRSVIFAGNEQFLSHDLLTEWLHANGQIKYIIFDPLSVHLIIDN